MDTLEWLTLTRHGESTANALHNAWPADSDAEETGIPERDSDIPLTETGRRQAAGLGRWLAALPEPERPTLVVTSPFLRARDTARIALEQAPYEVPVRVDERLRDRDQGVFEGLTAVGARRRFPGEVERKRRIGKFYYRPPGGESWTDLALRLRSFYRDLHEREPGGRVLVAAHDAIVVMTRYVVEGLTEEEILDIEKAVIGNCSVSRWRQDGGRLSPTVYNDSSHLA